ncbi:unnamed protein product [Medioppia subpectinata]|uniref:Uncharacterized protein n=1 Tax=Medioppia subpectinata TaxID=1979941 RepID=A0A7R9QN35_9ACAR|nr:unnamed protein product [Medioppia subpectinata]CAG2123475.1 unnamed protein product [Medioppia subpectinata]
MTRSRRPISCGEWMRWKKCAKSSPPVWMRPKLRNHCRRQPSHSCPAIRPPLRSGMPWVPIRSRLLRQNVWPKRGVQSSTPTPT